MGNELKIFQYNETDVRTVFIDGEPWWVLKDVCGVLGLSNPTIVADRLDNDEKNIFKTKSNLVMDIPNRGVTVVNESGLYNVIIRSDKPEAKQFKRWITHEVLPTIRKTGGYVANEETFIETYLPNADEPTKQLFKLNLEVIRQLNTKIDHMKPLAEFAEHVTKSSDTIEVGQLAKIAYDENIKLGRNKLFDWLRSKGYLRKNNEPYQEYIDKGLFKLKEQNFVTPYGPKISMKTLVTGRGQMEIIEHLRTEFQ